MAALEFLSSVDPLALAALAAAALSYLYLSRPRYALPPGPRPLPLLGNIFQMPKSKEWIAFADWSKTYGPIIYLNLLGRRVFVINSHDMAEIILEKNMNSYAHRPTDMVMASELIGWNRAVALNPGGNQHRAYRKLLAHALNSTAARRFRPLQARAAESLCAAIYASPHDLLAHIRASVGHAIVDIAYGREMRVKGQGYIDYAEFVHERFSLTARSYAYLVDMIPALKSLPSWLPGAGFKRDAVQWRKDLDLLAQAPFDGVKADVSSGDAAPSYVADLLAADARDEPAIMWTAASLYTGGADTTTAGLSAFIVLMCKYPEVQRTAQAELDAVVGRDRLPTHDDAPALPYLDATIKEVLRWWTVAPMGLPHRATKDEVYDGFAIPADATVIANIWGMMHDPAVYAAPHAFDPARFLPPRAERDPVPTVFGFGRRLCPGLHLAEGGLWAYAACLLACFEFAAPPGGVRCEVGEEIISAPKPFECVIRPRPGAAGLLGV